jgi:methionine synthase II (cobalamin-independent)
MNAAIRADHVGSLLRPSEVLEARRAGASPERLRGIEDRHILRALVLQQELGLDVLTDGEVRRRHFMSDFTDAVEGFDHGDAVAMPWKASTASDAPHGSVAGIVTAKIRQLRRLTGHEVPYLQAHSPGTFKITLPSATLFPAIAYKPGATDRVYPSRSALLWDIVAVIKGEVRALVADGVPYVQIDAPRYSYYVDPKWRDYVRTELGADPEAAFDEAIRADNACLEGARRPGLTVAIHLCRGNRRGHWFAEGGYEPIAEKLFGTLDVDRFLLEYDDERSGTFEPLRFVPKGKQVVLGLVTTKRPELEDKDALKRRIEDASRYVDIDQLCVSPQCGFSSTVEGNLVTREDQVAKLRLIVETAREVWG